MNDLGKRIIVLVMFWVLLVMAVTQVYDNVTSKGLPPRKATPLAQPTSEADPFVSELANLQSCLQSDPKNLKCATDLADLYYQARQWDQAQAAYLVATRLDPQNAPLLVKLAGTYIYQADFAKAIPTLKSAAAIKPDSPEIHLLLGLALSKVNPPRTDEAVAEWQQVLSIDPASAWASQAKQYLSEVGK